MFDARTRATQTPTRPHTVIKTITTDLLPSRATNDPNRRQIACQGPPLRPSSAPPPSPSHGQGKSSSRCVVVVAVPAVPHADLPPGSSKQAQQQQQQAPSGSDDGSAPPGSTAALQRGSACLACRKRKLKCDAGKPVCKQCMRANKPGECSYDNSDPRALSKTQVLQRRIRELEEKLKHLQAQNANGGSRPHTSNRQSPSLSHSDSTHSQASDEPPENSVPLIPELYPSTSSDFPAAHSNGDPFGAGLDVDPSLDDPSASSWGGGFDLALSRNPSISNPGDPKAPQTEGVVDVRSDWSTTSYPYSGNSDKDELSPKVKRYL